MSSDSGLWPVVAPGFMYIVKMGDFTHVIQAADQASSGHLNLAQSAIRDINVARNLLNERGPFLLSDKQVKMDEMITDTEEAIDRVVKLLEPARVEHISKESIRINTQNPWALKDTPKSAATFSRLRNTHDRLKTVVHDLNNIEATAQLDDCNTRANTAVDLTNRRQSMPDVLTTPVAADGRQLITWKRSRRSQRHGQNSNVSSISSVAMDERSANDIFSPVSAHMRSPSTPTGVSPRQQHDSPMTPTPHPHSDVAVDNASDVSAERLPVIHELEGPAFVQIGPIRPVPTTHDADTVTNPDDRVLVADSNSTDMWRGAGVNGNHVGIPSSSDQMPTHPIQNVKQNARMKRETFEEIRQREITSQGPNIVQQPPVSIQTGALMNGQSPDHSSNQYPGRFHSLNARQPPHRIHHSHNPIQSNEVVSNGTYTQVPEGQVMRTSRGDHVQPGVAPGATVPTQHISHSRQNITNQSQAVNGPEKSVTYPPLQTQAPYRGRQRPAVPDRLNESNGVTAGQVLSPSRTQLSPQEQEHSSQDVGSDRPPQVQPHMRNHQIFDIDLELQRLPSILRPAQARREHLSRPSSVASAANSDQREELYLTDSQLQPSPCAPERPIAGASSPRLKAQSASDLLQTLPTRDEYSHQRSMSDTIVPQINVTRAPTIPRKPLPYRGSASPSPIPSPLEVSRANTPIRERPQSEVLQTANDLQRMTKPLSGPPSPVQTERSTALAPPRNRSASVHSLSVQAPSSAGSSRRSSVSAEESFGKVPPLVQDHPRITNPLAMHPPEIPERQRSAFQAQAQAAVPTKISTKVPIAPPDYRSPAFLQSRQHFDPGHVHIEQGSESAAQGSSRFRDPDQSRVAPVPPNRSRTEPNLVPSNVPTMPMPKQESSRPRRASEQVKRSFLHHQTANMLAAAQKPLAIPPQVSTRSEQVGPPRPVQVGPPRSAYTGPALNEQSENEKKDPPRLLLTPQGTAGPNPSAPTNGTVPPATLPVAGNAVQGANTKPEPNRQASKDKDLFEKQKYRATPDKQIPPIAPPSSRPINDRQHSKHDTVESQHDCHCEESPSLTTSPQELSKVSPVQTRDEPQPMPMSEKALGKQRADRSRKKTSWLVHQASKIASRPGN